MYLQTKLLLAIGLAFLAAFGALEYYAYQRDKAQIEQQILSEARAIRGVLMATRRVYHHQFLDSDLPLNDDTLGFLPAHALSRISRQFSSWVDTGLSFNNVSDRPRNPDNAADPVEMEAIRYFRKHPDADERLSQFRTRDRRYYHYATPIWMERYCLRCHGDQEQAPATISSNYDAAFGYELGQLRGIMSIKLPVEALDLRLAEATRHQAISTTFAFAGAFLITAWLLRRYVTERVRRLAAASRRVKEGDYDARLDERGADELALAGAAFNEMAGSIQQREAQLQRSHAFTRTVIDGIVDPIMVIGSDYRVINMNESARRAHGRDEAAGEILYCYQASHHSDRPCDGDDHPCPLREVQETGRPVTVIHEHRLSDGRHRTYELEASPWFDDNGRVAGIIESSRDITERLAAEHALREKQTRLDHLAHHDTLTDLPNRLLLRDRLEHAMANARRSGGHVAILFIDLDRFKNVNDTLGHDVGDSLLQVVAHRLRNVLREGDTIARQGGDEFVLLVEGIDAPEDAATVAGKTLEVLARPINAQGYELYITPSIGISVFPDDAADSDSLLKNADTAMYRAKNDGRNTYRFYTADMNERAYEQLLLENELRQALGLEQLVVYYQPFFRLHDGSPLGAEALLRWQHPERGLVSPGEFIPLAEESGLIVPIGEWVLRQACSQLAAWHAAGHTGLQVAVNLSARQFHQPDLAGMVRRILEETGLPPHTLELEITESTVMEDMGHTLSVMENLHGLGVGFAIDDFGTGYSSLSHLKRFPLQKLKIDKGFVQDIPADANDCAIATSIIDLGHNMDLAVIAEGIETKAQRAFLLEHGCEQGQGFLFGYPAPPEAVAILLDEAGSPEDGNRRPG